MHDRKSYYSGHQKTIGLRHRVFPFVIFICGIAARVCDAAAAAISAALFTQLGRCFKTRIDEPRF